MSERVIGLARSSVNRPIRAAAAAAVGAVQRARGAASSAAALPILRALAQDRGATEVQVCVLRLLLNEQCLSTVVCSCEYKNLPKLSFSHK